MKAAAATIGILAHVDAGKTTLAENILYRAGVVRKLGRVDHQDTFLDTYALEKERGITIFSKQAVLELGERQITLLDTPGHVDFSAEMERTLQVLDYAVLLVSAPDGVTGHVYTLWRLLRRYEVPTLIFVNKMDQQGTDAGRSLEELRARLSEDCISFAAYGVDGNGTRRESEASKGDSAGQRIGSGKESEAGNESKADRESEAGKGAGTHKGIEIDASRMASGTMKDAAIVSFDETTMEEIASTDEEALEEYLEGGALSMTTIQRLIAERRIFPVFFGSALKGDGVEALLRGLSELTSEREYPEDFAARVFKIAREGGTRLTYLKVLGGSLKVKQTITSAAGEEKVDQIRLYSGSAYKLLTEAKAGCVCALTGPAGTRAGEGLGTLREATAPVLESVLNYSVILPEKEDVHRAYACLKQLEEELPELHVYYEQENALAAPALMSRAGEALPAGLKNSGIQIRVMGEVQIEIIRRLLAERFGIQARFGTGSIVYRETIAGAVEGVGHYEPLRHYAEVHLILEPGERGSGIVFESRAHTDDLDLNWQRLIETHVMERIHRGVLTGSELTDVHVVLAAGRAHLKHTEGGDFREATYRAIRQGLMQAESILLEPVYSFRLELPLAAVGRAISDIQAMNGSFTGPETDAKDPETAILTGTAPAAGMLGYQNTLSSYTRGEGRLSLTYKGYESCREQDRIVELAGYDPDADTANPSGSVFCSHGAGMFVPWWEVEDYMHLPAQLADDDGYFMEDGYASDAEAAASGFAGAGAGAGWEDESGKPRTSAHMSARTAAHASARTSGRPGAAGDLPPVDDKELMQIFTRTYGEIKKERAGWKKSHHFDPMRGGGASSSQPSTASGAPSTSGGDRKDRGNGKPLLLVDGYNIIHAWPKLCALADENLDAARVSLMDILANYRGYRQMTLILVFDAYKVAGGEGEVFDHHGIHVVYTREAETADTYIERSVHELARRFDITVATSDAAEQIIIWGEGARRMPAGELADEIRTAGEEIRKEYLQKDQGGRRYMFQELPENLRNLLEDIRLGREADGQDR